MPRKGIAMHLVEGATINDEVLSDIVARDCVLWLTAEPLTNGSDLDPYIGLVRGPWRAVYVETTSSDFAAALEEQGLGSNTTDSSGAFSHLIASDPLSLVLQRRAKPIFFLNGRSDRSGIEGPDLPSRSAVRRRLNMTARLRDLEPRRVIVVGDSPMRAVEDLVDLWDSELRSMLTLVTVDSAALDEAARSLEQTTKLSVVQWISQSAFDFAATLASRLVQLAVDTSLVVAVQLPGGKFVNADLASAELVEQPIADICEFIRLKDTLSVSPDDLRDEEFRGFFTRGDFSWRPYAAGLPWLLDQAAEKELLKRLHRQLADPPGGVQVLSVVSESGAGGTTQARALAYAAARAGFPVLLAKQESETPSALELTNFLFRAVGVVAGQAAAVGYESSGEPLWLLVLDVQHAGRGFEELERLCADLVRSGRRVALLKVVSAEAPLEPPESIPHTELAYVGHNLELDEVTDLGRHLNIFLRNFGKEKAPEEWVNFWQSHRPDLDTGIASFWIALEFWLAGFLALGESIQSWVLRQFKALSGGPEVQRGLMEIAAFSVERKSTPERLLRPLSSPKLPWSFALETARHESPGLGLLQAMSFPYGRVWGISHDVLARYLLNGIWNDRLLCEQISIQPYEDSVALRLGMIAEVCKRASTGETFARPFAIALATHVLKLDEQHGNAEFFKHWQQVISILESVPQTVRLSSRTFNHHLAISRRRITQGELFQIDDKEKKTLLLRAARDVEFALDQIDATQDDESNLNLLNTLALIYQDLAELERSVSGNREELARLLAKSDEITNRALKENPNSPYVLETAAKNLLRQTSSAGEDGDRVESAAKALSFVFQASRLDTAFARRMKLGQLAAQALRSLRDKKAVDAIERLCAQGSPYGYIAKAWCSLPVADDDEASLLLDSIDVGLATKAIETLNASPVRDWLLVRLLYDLVVIAHEKDFSMQLGLLDELAATRGYQLSLQQVLERAVLLYFAGQHKQANNEFQWLRPRVKESQVVVFVPQRLRWLLTPDRSARANCTAQVVDSSASARGMAKVKELGWAWAPFNLQEFGKSRMAPNEQFKCQVTFAAMGPFLKPIDTGHR